MQRTYGFTAGFRGMTDISSVIVLLFHSGTVSIVTFTDYLVIGPSSVSGIWPVVPGIYGTHLKYEKGLLQSVSIIYDPD